MNPGPRVISGIIGVLTAAAIICSGRAMAQETDNPTEITLRRYLLSFIQSGSAPGTIPASHSLHALSKAPLLATTSYILLENDPTLMSRFYEDITRIVMEELGEDILTGKGLIWWQLPGGRRPVLSPSVNALAAIELYALHLMAAGISAHEDAIELLTWSRNLSEATTKTFYRPQKAGFYAIDDAQQYIDLYEPGLLLPLIRNRNLGMQTRILIMRRYNEMSRVLKRTTGMLSHTGGIWDEPLLRPVVLDLLSTTPDMPSEFMELLADEVDPILQRTPPGAVSRPWLELWTSQPCHRRNLFPQWAAISSLIQLSLIIERESLQEKEKIARFRGDVDSLAAGLASVSLDLPSYMKTIGTANRLLANLSRMTAVINDPSKRFTVLDESKWNRISPRTRRLIREACFESKNELMHAKALLADALRNGTGISAEITLPQRPIRIGQSIEYRMRLRSSQDSITISRAYLQVGESRMTLTGEGERIALSPFTGPFDYTGSFSLPPRQEPGLVTLPVFFDLLADGKRIEMHTIEDVSLTGGFDVSLYFPDGRRLAESPLPVQIVLRYQPDHTVQGIARGAFLRDLRTSPPLPARFLIKEETDFTTLPIEIVPTRSISPGRYPFSLSLELDGKKIAVFEEELVKPFRWFFLGPLLFLPGFHSTAVSYQDDIFGLHWSTDGRELSWREVPVGALDSDGAVLPERLFGKDAGYCMLLYTVLEIRSAGRVRWKLETADQPSLWINGEPVLVTDNAGEAEHSGSVRLRKGINSFLVASCWNDPPNAVRFELSDESGLPVPDIKNDIDRIIEGFEQLARRGEPAQTDETSTEQMQPVVLKFRRPQASVVSVIGSFNNWDPTATPMKQTAGGIWQATLILPPGQYSYKFLIDRKAKIPDPEAVRMEADGFGGTNSILIVK
ncbi:MAG: isoamylase early set domain-containing protein [bacterium]|nr:MAG: isoamylase early set domain-containing protein [bacterium]